MIKKINLYNSNITKKILENCNNFQDKIMLEDIYWNKITWKNYQDKAFFYVKKFQELWIKKGDKIVIFIKNIVDFSAYALAVLLVWAKLIIIEPDYSEKILEEKLKFIKPDLVILEPILYYLLKIPFIRNISKIKKYNNFFIYSKKIIPHLTSTKGRGINKYSEKNINFINIEKNTESLVVFTWWTTWNPKWVVHTLGSLEIMFARISKIIWESTKIFYADLPHFVLIWISMGVKNIVWENNISDKSFLGILEKYKIDTIFSPPYRFINIIDNTKMSTEGFSPLQKILPKTLKHICLWSAPIYKSFLEKLVKNIEKDTKITCIYGMTEILPISYIDWREKINKKVDWDLLWKVLDNIEINILKDWELEISWDWLFKKYLWWENIKKHRTWDLVKFENWNLIMKWRKKDMILRKDYNIYPTLYEPIINSIPWIIESAMIWIFDKKLQDEKVILFIEWKKNIKFDLEKIIDKFALPDEIIFLDKMPRIWRQNKIDKNFLRNNYKRLHYNSLINKEREL